MPGKVSRVLKKRYLKNLSEKLHQVYVKLPDRCNLACYSVVPSYTKYDAPLPRCWRKHIFKTLGKYYTAKLLPFLCNVSSDFYSGAHT